MGRRAILVCHDNESIFNLQQGQISGWHTVITKIYFEQCNLCEKYKLITSFILVDYLVLVVGITVQSPSIGRHLKRVIVRVA